MRAGEDSKTLCLARSSHGARDAHLSWTMRRQKQARHYSKIGSLKRCVYLRKEVHNEISVIRCDVSFLELHEPLSLDLVDWRALPERGGISLIVDTIDVVKSRDGRKRMAKEGSIDTVCIEPD